ncbi:MAG: YqgE/AlgH family protein, partial [Planktomarina temperata]|nr:YqgE/AlgH family protein [Planktomarina temperata]
MTDAQTTFVGKLLVAMPGMGDPRFEHSVVYISAHSEDGAMGLIVNKANA